MHRIRECHDGLFERELTNRVVGAFYHVYNSLGYGFLESVYRTALARELTKRGFHVATEVPAEVTYDGEVVGVFTADILVESRVVLALTASRTMGLADEMQVLNYLRATDLELGMLLHFGPRPVVRRFISTNGAARGADSRTLPPSATFASGPAPGRRHPAPAQPLIAEPPPVPDPCPAPRPAGCPTP